ncbi:MAG: hypothetical protein JNL32_04870, partial [Candidatus Kapabacteria bacterium]|nr:hypothetical protein [Candidatus Kapabacteria bacterium]
GTTESGKRIDSRFAWLRVESRYCGKFRTQRYARMGHTYQYHETLDQAIQYLVERATDKIGGLKAQVEMAEIELQQIKEKYALDREVAQ